MPPHNQSANGQGRFRDHVRASSVFHPNEWSKAVKATVAGITTIGGIIAMFVTVESWTDEKIQTAVSASEKRQIEEAAKRHAIHDISHDKMIQGERITTAEANIRIAQIELSLLEAEIDGRRADGRKRPGPGRALHAGAAGARGSARGAALRVQRSSSGT